MTFTIPEGLSPDVYPLAWLVGKWRGVGEMSYHEEIPTQRILSEITFDHDGGPYLRYESIIRVLGDGPAAIPGPVLPVEGADAPPPQAPPVAPTAAEIADATVWSAETGYWRVSTLRDGGLASNEFPLEVFIADASGRMTFFNGFASPARVELASAKLVRAATAADVVGSKRMYGFVQGQLAWAEDLVAFGHDLSSYASALLQRVDESDASNQDGAAEIATGDGVLGQGHVSDDAEAATGESLGAAAPDIGHVHGRHVAHSNSTPPAEAANPAG